MLNHASIKALVTISLCEAVIVAMESILETGKHSCGNWLLNRSTNRKKMEPHRQSYQIRNTTH